MGKLLPCTQQNEKNPVVQGLSGKEKTLTFVSRLASFYGFLRLFWYKAQDQTVAGNWVHFREKWVHKEQSKTGAIGLCLLPSDAKNDLLDINYETSEIVRTATQNAAFHYI